MNVIIFLGPAGSGKGTQAQFLKTAYEYLHLSTGDLLRHEVQIGSELGKKAKQIMDAGNLVSDQIILGIIESNLDRISSSPPAGVIFDGFPRTLDQAHGLNLLLKKHQLNLTKVFYFELSLAHSVDRISGRLVDSRTNTVYHREYSPPPSDAEPYLVAREDDTAEKVKHRYDVYMNQTEPLLAFYENELVTINSASSIEYIQNQLCSIIDTLPVSA